MGKFLTSYIDFFVHFFAICQELVKKIIYSKKVGVTDYPSELNLSEVNATDTIPLCESISFFVRALVHDATWRCDMNCVRSKDAHKQLARTSLTD